MKRIYFDNASTTPIIPAAKKAMLLSMENFGNASSMHEDGRKVHEAIEDARRKIAQSINAIPSEIIFTSGGSEANNMVLNTFSNKKITVSSIEHPSVLEPAKKLGAKIVSVNKLGRVENLSEIEKADLVSVMYANNEIGTLQDIKKIAKEAHEKGALFHSDAVQAYGKLPIDVKKLGVDYLTISGHKIGGPKGIGALYVREGALIEPLILGGHQENNLRAGTENTLAIIGFGEAAVDYDSSGAEVLRQKLYDGIIDAIPNVVINGDLKNCLPNILNVTFAGVEGESILLKLDHLGISVSTGSACATKEIASSHVLMAIGADPEKAHGSIRFSFGPQNTVKEVEKVLKVLPKVISDLRRMSTIGGKYEQ